MLANQGTIKGNQVGTPLATAIGRYFGRFTAPVTIPWTPSGQHKLIAVGSEGSRAETTITVS